MGRKRRSTTRVRQSRRRGKAGAGTDDAEVASGTAGLEAFDKQITLRRRRVSRRGAEGRLAARADSLAPVVAFAVKVTNAKPAVSHGALETAAVRPVGESAASNALFT